jgi:hypothetical protein
MRFLFYSKIRSINTGNDSKGANAESDLYFFRLQLGLSLCHASYKMLLNFHTIYIFVTIILYKNARDIF